MHALTRLGQAIARRLRGRPAQSTQVERPYLRLGSDYGGYAVCLEGIDSDSVVYSFGIGEDISFDRALIERFGATVHAFDPTPRSIAWARGQDLPEQLVLHEWGLADYDGTATFTPPDNPDHISHTLLERSGSVRQPIQVEVLRLPTILERLGHEHLEVLKMDIEGAEYAVIDDLLATDIRPTQLLLEFHHHLEGVPLSATTRAIRRLNEAGYGIFHVSSTAREFSLVKT